MESRGLQMVKLALKVDGIKKDEVACSSSKPQNQTSASSNDGCNTHISDHASDSSFTESDDDSVKDKLWTPDDNGYDADDQPLEEPFQLIADSDIPDNNHENLTEEDTTEKVVPRKRSRWTKSNPSQWSRNVEKKNKFSGLPYKTKNVLKSAKAPQPVNCESCKFKCNSVFTEEDRKNICKSFWALSDYKRQKDFILKFVERKMPERPGANVPMAKKRKWSRSCYFMKDEEKYRVCQNFFQKTLNISNGPINKAFEGCSDGVFTAEDKRGKRSPHNKSKNEDVEFVKQHIEMFPTMESHYCRKNTQRRYLDAKLSIKKMYSLYTDFCEQNDRIPLSHSMYRKIFCTSYNLSFFVPKKDQCVLCNNYQEAKRGATITSQLEILYSNHISRKEEANLAKEEDKIRSNNDDTFMSATFDLQSVLQIPSGEESLLYYCRKLCVYNFTLYESRSPNEAYCMLWSEVNGKRGSNEIGSALYHWIKKLPANIKEVSLFSDTCGGQNRNQHIAALLLFLVQTTHLDVIEQKFLESGHSFMEVDSMHSAIEKEKKFVSVSSVSDWMNIMRKARSKRNRESANPYHVSQLNFSDILDLKDLSRCLIKNRVKDEDGEKVNWLVIKCLRYEKENPKAIKFRYGHSGPYKVLNVSGRGRQNVVKEIKKAYNQQLPISVKKKQDLVKLCGKGIIPPELHPWYESLPAAISVHDLATEPALEDNEGSEYSDTE